MVANLSGARRALESRRAVARYSMTLPTASESGSLSTDGEVSLLERRGSRLLVGSAVAAGLALRLWLMFGVRYFEEDALITLRFGSNLIDGRGWVYNAGEHVL